MFKQPVMLKHNVMNFLRASPFKFTFGDDGVLQSMFTSIIEQGWVAGD